MSEPPSHARTHAQLTPKARPTRDPKTNKISVPIDVFLDGEAAGSTALVLDPAQAEILHAGLTYALGPAPVSPRGMVG